MRRALLICFLIFLLSGVSASPTSQPVRADWDQTLASLAKCVVDNDPKALPDILSANSEFARFNGEASAPGKLLAFPRKRTLLFCKAYGQIPETLASDLSEVASNWKQPDEIKSLFQIGTPQGVKFANQTAQRWLTKNLQAKPGDSLGVAVFLCQEPDEAATGMLLFILVKGRTETAGVRVIRLVFGDPLSE